MSDGPVKIVAKRDCPCLTCRRRIVAGETVLWEPDVGSWHEACPAPEKLDLWRDAANARARIAAKR